MWQLEAGWWVALVLGSLLALLMGQIALARRHRRAVSRRRLGRAQQGERAAQSLLRAQGYEILDAQVTHNYRLECDGQPQSVSVRVDYVVRRNRRRYLAEVKTGSMAPRLANAATRRQLLEYVHAYGLRDVLLVDMDAEEVRHVTFPDAARGVRCAASLWLGLTTGGLAGVLIGQLLARLS